MWEGRVPLHDDGQGAFSFELLLRFLPLPFCGLLGQCLGVQVAGTLALFLLALRAFIFTLLLGISSASSTSGQRSIVVHHLHLFSPPQARPSSSSRLLFYLLLLLFFFLLLLLLLFFWFLFLLFSWLLCPLSLLLLLPRPARTWLTAAASLV